jgi:hypothetical protein
MRGIAVGGIGGIKGINIHIELPQYGACLWMLADYLIYSKQNTSRKKH